MFVLDLRLAADTLPVTVLPLCEVRLKRGAAGNPWLVLVPQRPGLVEMHDLMPGDRYALMDEIAAVGAALKSVSGCDKINVAAFGNMVAQMHVHVIARYCGDRWWPGAIDMGAPPVEWAEPAFVAFRDRFNAQL